MLASRYGRGVEVDHDNNAWVLVDLPNNEKVMDLKWEFMIKKDADGSVKHKARLVAKEYVQEEGVDFEEAFVPIERMESVRLLIALAVQESWKIHHLDVKSTFLNGELQGDIYVNNHQDSSNRKKSTRY